MIVLIDNSKSYEQVKQVYNAFNMLIPNENQSVLFRAESNDEENHYLNDFIKSNNLNNWVDKTTKIVYIKKNKLPKLLLTTDFKPQTAFSISSDRTNTVVNAYVEFNCDLILYNDEHFSSFKRYSF
jgi:Tol biopolymer transport system component